MGKNIKKYFLKKKIKCIYLSTKNFDLTKITKTKIKKYFKKNSIVIYAAGKHRKFGDTVELRDYNIRIFNNFLINVDNKIIDKIIFLSTVEVYGDKKKLKISEKSSLNPLNLYADGKLSQELELKKFSKKNKINFNILRLPGFYGKDDKNSIISKMYLFLKKRLKIKFITNGNELRDYVFIDDLVKIINLFVENENKKFYRIFNIVQGKSFKIKKYLFF